LSFMCVKRHVFQYPAHLMTITMVHAPYTNATPTRRTRESRLKSIAALG